MIILTPRWEIEKVTKYGDVVMKRIRDRVIHHNFGADFRFTV